MTQLVFTPLGWEDYRYWQATDKATLRRVNRLLHEALRDPFSGVGKPEPLRHVLAGCWSRRIDEEHRLVYLVTDKEIIIIAARYHY